MSESRGRRGTQTISGGFEEGERSMSAKECRRPGGAENSLAQTARKETGAQSYNHKELSLPTT